MNARLTYEASFSFFGDRRTDCENASRIRFQQNRALNGFPEPSLARIRYIPKAVTRMSKSGGIEAALAVERAIKTGESAPAGRQHVHRLGEGRVEVGKRVGARVMVAWRWGCRTWGTLEADLGTRRSLCVRNMARQCEVPLVGKHVVHARGEGRVDGKGGGASRGTWNRNW